jgi:hypothetical protein
VHRALSAAGPGLLVAAAILGVGHAISFVRDFVLGREYQRLTIMSLVFWPYARMSIVGAVLLLGIAVAGSVRGLGRETVFAAMMVLLKLGADVVSHTLERRWVAPEPQTVLLERAA